MSVRALDDGTLLVHCFAGCSVEQITLAAGMYIGDLFPEKKKTVEHRPPLKRVFNAHAVLDALASEINVAYLICCAVYAKKEITREDHNRLGLALQRMHEAKRLANGPS